MSQPTNIYRAKRSVDNPYKSRSTRRQPGNVPYLVDNLWAWTRPEGYPNRRHAAYASPSPEQAIQSAGDKAKAYHVSFQGDYTLAQLGTDYPDAKHHPDCRELKRQVRKALDGNEVCFSWASRAASDKDPAGQLYYPCLTAEEVEEVFRSVDALRARRDAIRREAMKFWSDVTLIEGDTLANDHGELFFTYLGGYKLVPIPE